MRTKQLTLLSCAITFATTVFAQGGGTPPRPAQIVANRVSRLTTVLSLTSAQQSSATTIFTTEETALSGFRTTMTTDREALQTAIEANDAAAIAAAAAQIGTITTQEVQTRGTADAAFYATLTADQQTKYKQLQESGGHGPHGGGGPHPPDAQ